MINWSQKVNFSNIKKQKDIVLTFYIWLILSIGTVMAFHFQLSNLRHIDIPTHIMAGVVITAFIFAFVENGNLKKAFLFALVPFLLWEAIEISMAMIFDQGFIFRIFSETWKNRAQDMAMDSLGFISFVTVKKYQRRKKV
jgi:hypothetical protein